MLWIGRFNEFVVFIVSPTTATLAQHTLHRLIVQRTSLTLFMHRNISNFHDRQTVAASGAVQVPEYIKFIASAAVDVVVGVKFAWDKIIITVGHQLLVCVLCTLNCQTVARST